MSRQKKIFDDNAWRVIDPDNSAEYWAAKRKFDAADRRIKQIEKKIARLVNS
ncbi:MAG: hypothetical protein P1Q69_13610 [Candidatus Thorarchaeota archaeon]|nr:hypothetical protein [Candidatus Thorarchaeota archaeon]